MEKKTVFVYKSVWEYGAEFEGSIVLSLFGTKEKACKALKLEAEQIKEIFAISSRYNGVALKVCETDTFVEIAVDNYDDCWTGEVCEQEVE